MGVRYDIPFLRHCDCEEAPRERGFSMRGTQRALSDVRFLFPSRLPTFEVGVQDKELSSEVTPDFEHVDIIFLDDPPEVSFREACLFCGRSDIDSFHLLS